jgi:hypothetical protein
VPFYLADLVQQRLGIEFARMRIEADPAGQSAAEAPPAGTTRPSRIAAAIDSYRREFEGRLIPSGSVDAAPTVVEIDPMNQQRVVFELPIDVLEWLVSMAGNARQIG